MIIVTKLRVQGEALETVITLYSKQHEVGMHSFLKYAVNRITRSYQQPFHLATIIFATPGSNARIQS